jgi:hypothetical protein
MERCDSRAAERASRSRSPEIARSLDRFLAAEVADDALLGLAVLANGLDQI